MRLGHFALSQTVSNLNSSNNPAVKLLKLPIGKSRFSQGGNLRLGTNPVGSLVEAPPQLPDEVDSETTGRSNAILG